MPIPRSYAFVVFFLLTAAGLAANFFPYEIFFDIQFVYGSIFALLALQVLGLGPGVLSAVIVSTATWALWNHPYAVVIMSCEVLAAGWLFRRRGVGLVGADALYWFFLGIPLVLLFYVPVMGLSIENGAITAVKQALNGIGNALAARLFFVAVAAARRTARFTLRELILNLLAAAVLVPSLLLLSIQSKMEYAATDRAIRQGVADAGRRTAVAVETWLGARTHSLAQTAMMAGLLPASFMQQALERQLAREEEFDRIGLADARAVSVAHAPGLDEFGASNIGLSFADRPYLPQLRRELEPLLTEVMLGRTGVPAPIIGIVVPVVVDGAYSGFVGGVIELRRLQAVLDLAVLNQSLPGMKYALLDKTGKVIVSNVEGRLIMDPFTRKDGELLQPRDGVAEWVPAARRLISVSNRWEDSLYVTEQAIGGLAASRLILEQPVAPFRTALFEKYARQMAIILALFAAALGFAELASRRVVMSLERLKAFSADLSGPASGGRPAVWLPGAVVEIEELADNYQQVAAALSRSFAELGAMNAALEAKVGERTRSLKEAQRLLEEAQKLGKLGGWQLDVATGRITWTPEVYRIYGVGADFNPSDAAAAIRFYPEPDRRTIVRAFQRAVAFGETYDLELEFTRSNGERIWVRTIGNPELENGKVVTITGTIMEITGRKRAEARILRSLKEKEVLLKEIHHRVKNNMQVIYSLLNLQARGVADATVRAMFEESRERVSSMALIHEQLYRSADLAHIDFKSYLRSLAHGIASAYRRPEIELIVDMEGLTLDVNTGIPCGLIVNELVSNAFKHAFPEGRAGTIRVGMSRTGEGGYLLTVADDGAGFPAHVDFRDTGSLGLQLVNVLVGQIQGTIELERAGGTRFSMAFPGAAPTGEERYG